MVCIRRAAYVAIFINFLRKFSGKVLSPRGHRFLALEFPGSVIAVARLYRSGILPVGHCGNFMRYGQMQYRIRIFSAEGLAEVSKRCRVCLLSNLSESGNSRGWRDLEEMYGSVSPGDLEIMERVMTEAGGTR